MGSRSTTAFFLAGACFLCAAAPVLRDRDAPPVEHPFDSGDAAHQAVDAAFAAARANHHRVIIDFGANWCADCRVIAGVFASPVARPWIAQHYEIVGVNIGRFTRNMDIPQRFGVRLKAVPALLVVTPDGQVVNRESMLALADAGDMSAEDVMKLLEKWAE